MRFILILLTLTACDINPLGNNSFPGCNHSPTNKTGLPVTCQVNIPSTQGLTTWLDAHDSGTLNLNEQSDITSWVDKSGTGISMFFQNGTKAKVSKRSSNDRNSILFGTLGTYVAVGGLTSIPAGNDFTVAISFKTGATSGGSVSFNNGTDFSLTITPTNGLLYSIGAQDGEITGIVLRDNLLVNLIITYKASSKTISIQDIGNGFSFNKANTLSSGVWSDIKMSGTNANINELIIYNKVVDTTSLQNYLNSKWGF